MTEDLAAGLRDLYIASQRALDRIMRTHGASFARTKLLLFVDRAEWVRAIDLAEAFSYAPRTVTEAIDGLERDGLVRRDPDPVDRRTKRISITEAGRAVLRTSEPARKQFVAEVFGVLDAGESEAFGRVLEKLLAQVHAMTGEQADGQAGGGLIGEGVQPSSE